MALYPFSRIVSGEWTDSYLLVPTPALDRLLYSAHKTPELAGREVKVFRVSNGYRAHSKPYCGVGDTPGRALRSLRRQIDKYEFHQDRFMRVHAR